jgi:hypothetical protein
MIVLITGCGGKQDTPTPPPGKATLTFPAQNSVCTTGTVLSDTLSSITFTWTASTNTDSYEVDIINLLTNSLKTQTVNTNQISVNLTRNTPFSWYIVSKSNKVSNTAQSDVWKFYNSGLGVSSHPPFPADLTSPGFGQNVSASAFGTVNLTWTGSDVDNDIIGYDLYFGTTSAPPVFITNIPNMYSNSVNVVSGKTYYWKVVTKDSQGNTSDSDVYQFTVD